MKKPPPPLIAEFLRHAIKTHGVTPADVAARVFPMPNRGRDRSRTDRAAFADQLARLVGPTPHPDDTVIAPRLALALDRVLGLPNAFCLLMGALGNAILAMTAEGEFLARAQPTYRPVDLACSYAVIAHLGTGMSYAVVDGKLPPGSASFPSEITEETATKNQSPLPPPTGYKSWLDYAIATMDVRDLENSIDSGLQPQWQPGVTREAMRMAAREELAKLVSRAQ